MASKAQLRTTGWLSGLVIIGAAALWWSNKQVPDVVRDERRARVFTALRRDQVQRVEVDRGIERFTCRKDGARWVVEVNGRSNEADDTEVERMLNEAEFAQPTRALGALDATTRRQFGLDAPRARVTLHDSSASGTTRFTIGADVRDERAVYVEFEQKGYVVPRSVADAFLVRARDLRSRNLVEVEVDRVSRIELTRPGSTVSLDKQPGAGSVWRVDRGERASRAAIEALLGDLRELRATRFLEDEATPQTLARHGLDAPSATMTVTRASRPSLVIRYGGQCPGHSDEVVVRRDDSSALACVSRTSLENATRPVEQLRDNTLLATRPDEVERIVLHSASGDVTARRSGETWRLEGAPGAGDFDSVNNWLDALAALRVESREDATQAQARGLAAPSRWIEITRTGVEGRERIEVGARDDDHVYVRREGEQTILALANSADSTLFVDAARFRASAVIRDVPEELRALVTDGLGFRDEATRDAGRWSLVHPISAGADPLVMRTVAERLASLDAQRWVSLETRPEHGLDRPAARMVARFEGAGVATEDAGTDGGPARVREYTVLLGAVVATGGRYAKLAEKPGVFVLAQSVIDELWQPHLEREILSFDRAAAQRVECVQANGPRLTLRREGNGWRIDGGASFDRSRVEALLETLSSVRAPRVFGYGPPPANAGLGEASVAISVGGDGGMRIHRITVGREFAGSPSGVYARVDAIDGTASVSEEVSRAIRACTP